MGTCGRFRRRSSVPVLDATRIEQEVSARLGRAWAAIGPTDLNDRAEKNWRKIGTVLTTLHGVFGDRFGLADFDGFFGPLPQDNHPDRARPRPLRVTCNSRGAEGVLDDET